MVLCPTMANSSIILSTCISSAKRHAANLIRHSHSSSSKSWLARQGSDHFVKERAAANYRSRSAFKLLEIDDKFRVFTPPTTTRPVTIVDLGAAPGGWCQVAAERLRMHPSAEAEQAKVDMRDPLSILFDSPSKAMAPPDDELPDIKILAVDLLPMPSPPIPGVTAIRGDFLHPDTKSIIQDQLSWFLRDEGKRLKVDVVLSDMAGNATGNSITNIQSSLELCESVMLFVDDWMRKGGILVMKYFDHPELHDFARKHLHPVFYEVRYFKPKASRQDSSETYWICRGYRQTKPDWDRARDKLKSGKHEDVEAERTERPRKSYGLKPSS